MASPAESTSPRFTADLAVRFAAARELTVKLTRPLAEEDMVVQSMPDVSPTKWHLAHVTWFFERFILEHHAEGYQRFNDAYDYLFNSYYHTAGKMHARPRRGLLSRPTFNEVLAYRRHVDTQMLGLIEQRSGDAELEFLVALGINHEQQHQELLLTDIKHVLWCNPLQPAYNAALPAVEGHSLNRPLSWSGITGGVCRIGASGTDFFFDNETPRHDALLHDCALADRLVTNGEFRDFIRNGGYSEPSLWLSDGWSVINERGWNRPLYWQEDLEREYTLGGWRPIDWHAPVVHVSYYEADAFARWAGARLPTEFEWEQAAANQSIEGNLFDIGILHPRAATEHRQFYGDTWEWTSSAYAPYPGFKPLAGSLGEYNGKFMCNQMTVRGGSCITSASHIRPSYRSFFYPDARWQFLGFRLARDPGR